MVNFAPTIVRRKENIYSYEQKNLCSAFKLVDIVIWLSFVSFPVRSFKWVIRSVEVFSFLKDYIVEKFDEELLLFHSVLIALLILSGERKRVEGLLGRGGIGGCYFSGM